MKRSKRISGVKSVDFKIIAGGHGVVNWNGTTEVEGHDGKTINNHSMPKLRGYTNLSGRIKEKEEGQADYKYRKRANDLDFKKNPLYISANCFRHHLFKDHSQDSHQFTDKNILQVLPTITGLVRGYMVPSKSNMGLKRQSALFIGDLVDTLANGNYEQFSRAGVRDSSSFYSKVTFGDTQYIGYGSISIESLQFISLDQKYDSAAAVIKEGQGETLAQDIEAFLKSIDDENNPTATFHPNYVRNGRIFNDGEAGILLNEDAIENLVWFTLDLIENAGIRQGQGDMYVDQLLVDYNDSNRAMRIKRDEGAISNERESPYATYYTAVDGEPA